MFVRRYGILHCPGCMCAQMFIAHELQGVARNAEGAKVRHITDASCEVCNFIFGRKSIRDERTGHVVTDQPVISDAIAREAARLAGLPARHALGDRAAIEPDELPAPSVVADAPPVPPEAAPSLRSTPALSTGASASLRSPPAPGPAGRVPDGVGPRSAGGGDERSDSMSRFMRQQGG